MPKAQTKSDRRPFGRRLRALRDKRGMTAQALADAAGLHGQTVRMLELGMSAEPRESTIVALCRALGVSADELLGLR